MMTTTSSTPSIRTGDCLYGLRVVEASGSVLRLAAPRLFALVALLIGAGALAAYLAIAIPVVSKHGFGALFSNRLMPDGHMWLFGMVVAGLGFGLYEFDRMLQIDGNQRSLTRRRFFVTKSWLASEITSLDLDVAHEGPREIVRLSFTPQDGKAIVIAQEPSDKRGQFVVAIAIRISQLLAKQLTRNGEVVQGDQTLAAEMEPVASEVGTSDGRDLLIHCPECGAKHTKAVAWELDEEVHGIRKRTTYVRCLACGKDMIAPLPPDQLSGLSADELEPLLRKSRYGGAVAVLAIAAFFVPLAGMIAALLALWMNWRNPGWRKTLSIIAVVLASAASVAFGILMNQ